MLDVNDASNIYGISIVKPRSARQAMDACLQVSRGVPSVSDVGRRRLPVSDAIGLRCGHRGRRVAAMEVLARSEGLRALRLTLSFL